MNAESVKARLKNVAMDADLGGPDEEKSEDRIENAGIVAEDKGIYMPDRNRKRSVSYTHL